MNPLIIIYSHNFKSWLGCSEPSTRSESPSHNGTAGFALWCGRCTGISQVHFPRVPSFEDLSPICSKGGFGDTLVASQPLLMAEHWGVGCICADLLFWNQDYLKGSSNAAVFHIPFLWPFVTNSTSLVRHGTRGTQKQLLLALKIFGLIPFFLLGGRISYWDAKKANSLFYKLWGRSPSFMGFFPGETVLKEPY